MSYFNAPHRSSTAEEVFRLTELYILWTLVGFFIQPLFFFFFAQFFYGSHNGRGGDYSWKGYPHVCPPPMLNYLVTAEFLICQLQTNSELWYGFIPWGHQTITYGRFITLDCFQQGRNRALSSLKQTCILDMGWLSLPLMLLPTSPSKDFYYGLFIIMTFVQH